MEPGAPFAWPETDEVGSGVAAAIGMDKYACLMAKHGADAYAVNNGEIRLFDQK